MTIVHPAALRWHEGAALAGLHYRRGLGGAVLIYTIGVIVNIDNATPRLSVTPPAKVH